MGSCYGPSRKPPAFTENAATTSRYTQRRVRAIGDAAKRLRERYACSAYKDGRARIRATSRRDYAFYADGLLSLYGATFEPRWLTAARDLLDTTVRTSGTARAGGFFSTADFHEALVARPKDLYDNAIPSGQLDLYQPC